MWDAFHDPAVLARCLPGCERLTELGPDHYAMTVTAGVAAIKGTYDGEVSLRDPQHPELLHDEGLRRGRARHRRRRRRRAPRPVAAGGTELTYDADASVGGVIGGVGQRMLAGVTKKMAGQFFAAVDADISGVRAARPERSRGRRRRRQHPAYPVRAPAPVSYAGRPAPAAPFAGRDFALGVVTGGAVALVGVVVGWAIGRRG